MDSPARLTGPVQGQPGIVMAAFDLGRVGYTLEEFFFESTATRFEPAGPGEYAAAFGAATTRAAAAGFLLDQDVEEMIAVATAAYPAL
jgi:hypothetical protein